MPETDCCDGLAKVLILTSTNKLITISTPRVIPLILPLIFMPLSYTGWYIKFKFWNTKELNVWVTAPNMAKHHRRIINVAYLIHPKSYSSFMWRTGWNWNRYYNRLIIINITVKSCTHVSRCSQEALWLCHAKVWMYLK